jgi:hypothetical protein
MPSALKYTNVWREDGGGNKARRDTTATGAENLALQESVSFTALMSVGPEDKAVGFTILDVMHERLGHMSERNIKYAVKNHLYAGCNVTYDQIKDERQF